MIFAFAYYIDVFNLIIKINILCSRLHHYKIQQINVSFQNKFKYKIKFYVIYHYTDCLQENQILKFFIGLKKRLAKL